MKPIDVEFSVVKDLLGKKASFPNKKTGRKNTGVIVGILENSFIIQAKKGVTVKMPWIAIDFDRREGK